MSLFSRLFGGAKQSPEAESETYQGFTITPEPKHEGSDFRISARIEKTIDGEIRTHTLIRADTLGSRDAAIAASAAKAKQLIDEQGDGIFD